MTKDEALKLALWHEAMAREPNRNQAKREKHEATAKFINEALAQPEQEPVAVRYDFDGYGYQYIDSGSGSDWQKRVRGEPLYTTPKIEVGCAECGVNGGHALYCVKCAEKYLKEKNT